MSKLLAVFLVLLVLWVGYEVFWQMTTSEHCKELNSTYTTYYDPEC